MQMTDLLVDYISTAYKTRIKLGMKRKGGSSPMLNPRQGKKASGAALRKKAGADEQFIQVCTVKRDRRSVEDIQDEMRIARHEEILRKGAEMDDLF